MKRPQFTSKNWIYSWHWKSSKTRQQYCRSESFAMKTDILMNGWMVKNHISFKTGFGFPATRRISFLLWFQACQRVLPPVLILQPQWHLQDRRVIILHLPQARLLHQPQLCKATVRLERKGRSEWDRFPSSACVKFTCWRKATLRPIVAQGNQKSKTN